MLEERTSNWSRLARQVNYPYVDFKSTHDNVKSLGAVMIGKFARSTPG